MVEQEQRRAELAMYVAPKAAESLYKILYRKHWVKGVKHWEVMTFSFAMSLIMVTCRWETERTMEQLVFLLLFSHTTLACFVIILVVLPTRGTGSVPIRHKDHLSYPRKELNVCPNLHTLIKETGSSFHSIFFFGFSFFGQRLLLFFGLLYGVVPFIRQPLF